MDVNKKSRLNELAKNFGDVESRIIMMEEFGDSETSFSGVNENGENILISISKDSITVCTCQINGWIRTNTYDAYGFLESESYEK